MKDNKTIHKGLRGLRTMVWVMVMVLQCSVVLSATISDISNTDPAYPAAQQGVKKGYFQLVDDTKFLPNQPVTRKEMAIMMAQLDSMMKKGQLSAEDASTIRGFSKQFKDYLAGQDKNSKGLGTDVERIKSEQKSLHYDISAVEDHLQQVEKNHKEKDSEAE